MDENNTISKKEKKINLIPIVWIIGLYLIEIAAEVIAQLFGGISTITKLTSFLWMFSKIVPLIVVFSVFHGKFSEFGRKVQEGPLRFVIGFILSFLVFYLVNSATSYYQLFMNKVFNIGEASNQSAIYTYFQESNLLLNYIFLFITIVLLAPVLEEMEFRILVFDIFKKQHFIVPVIVSGLLFGLIHLDFTKFFTSDALLELSYFPEYCIPGFALALIYHYNNKNGFVNMMVHMGINLIAFFQIVNQLTQVA